MSLLSHWLNLNGNPYTLVLLSKLLPPYRMPHYSKSFVPFQHPSICLCHTSILGLLVRSQSLGNKPHIYHLARK